MSLSAIPAEVKEAVIASQRFGLTAFHPASGGCINNGGMLDTSNGKYFLKWNQVKEFPNMFQSERSGLDLLRSTSTIRIPEVTCTGASTSFQFILMEWIRSSHKAKHYWKDLGKQLATLHRHTSEQFGLDHDNYIGSLPQRNIRCKTWSDFFVSHRLEPQFRSLHVDGVRVKKFDLFCKRLPGLIPEETPALLHGDLWSGNILEDEHGGPVLIDPAVFFGHREAELAFTRLFGGFDDEFYRVYNEVFPLSPEHHKRAEIFNIYPLLVHANLFGGSYLSQAFRIIDRWA